MFFKFHVNSYLKLIFKYSFILVLKKYQFKLILIVLTVYLRLQFTSQFTSQYMITKKSSDFMNWLQIYINDKIIQ